MFEGWQDYFLLVGSAAGALIGLLFVVVTLTIGRDLSSIERGQRLYMTPVVFQLGGILLLSGAALAPPVTPTVLGLASATVGLVGIISGLRITIGMRQVAPDASSSFDTIWYGIVPTAAYTLLLATGCSLLVGFDWALNAFAIMLMAQLLVSMHNAWDLLTYLAPRSNHPDQTVQAEHLKPSVDPD